MVRFALMFTKREGYIGLWSLIPTIVLLSSIMCILAVVEKGGFEQSLCILTVPILILMGILAVEAIKEWGTQKFRKLFKIYPRREYELGVMKKLGAVARAIGESPEGTAMVGVAKKRYREFWYAAQAFGFPTFKHLNEHITF